jgi:hypothetical protein
MSRRAKAAGRISRRISDTELSEIIKGLLEINRAGTNRYQLTTIGLRTVLFYSRNRTNNVFPTGEQYSQETRAFW